MNYKKTSLTITILVLSFIITSSYIYSVPVGPTINYLYNDTSSRVGTGTLRNDSGGYIYTIFLNASQQNYGWKAYVGNITGKLVLEDSSNYSIYDWDLANPNAEVYISRNQSVDWTTVNCSNSSNMAAEDTALNKNSTNADSINRTFNVTGKHKTFLVAGRTIQNSTCPSIATFAGGNKTKQVNGEANLFQEILLQDSAANLIYTTIAETDAPGYDNRTYDFQAIVADHDTIVNTGYYFYVELG